MSKVGVVIFSVCFFLSCAGEPQDDWIGTWYEQDTGIHFTFNRDGTITFSFGYQTGESTDPSSGTYSVDEDTYRMSISLYSYDFNLLRPRFETIKVSGSWILSEGVLKLETYNGVIILRRAKRKLE